MTPEQISALLQSITPLLTLAGLAVTGTFLVLAEVQRRKARRDTTPESVNETTRIGNDFLTGLLKEAREERKELRETIRDLERDGTTKRERISALESLAERKDDQILVLERRAEKAAAKLRAGYTLTVADILGPHAELADELGLGDLEDTQTTH
ncbi:chromosome segregation ATPase [Microbacterium foliorum]|uniref:Chromosome segregation ATPase n=1 Tax=Microbacterium foliorum TaxID=104336 RepID=A0ABU1HST5_9MICO|nr:hypothetical protein [Microbacterium foliorum]MDR6142379.1 chromosome segregation ATPase [Microbacterium foliorum]